VYATIALYDIKPVLTSTPSKNGFSRVLIIAYFGFASIISKPLLRFIGYSGSLFLLAASKIYFTVPQLLIKSFSAILLGS
jgi:hypothetical protein